MPVYIPDSNNVNRSVKNTTTPAGLAFNPRNPGVSTTGLAPYVLQALNTKTAAQKNTSGTTVGAASGGNVTTQGGGLGQTQRDPLSVPGSAPANMATVSVPPVTQRGDTRLTNLTTFNNTTSTKVTPLPPGNPFEYDWNLPPHKWSLPTLHTVVNEDHYKSNKIPAPKVANDSYRRGRLWWKANPDISVVSGNAARTQTKTTVGDVGRKYGFQFLWNPESFGTSVSVQLDATPTVQDRFLGVSGAFPGTEAISFVVRIDRTNDFACAATLLNRLNVDLKRRNTAAPSAFSEADVKEFASFYTSTNSFQVQPGNTQRANIGAKLVDLLQRGTLADIEYLYKAINGAGPGGANEAGKTIEWMNGRGIKTADIGWLMPTLLHVDIGPLSYDGYVTALQVNHTYFTPDMIPLRTDLNISLNVLATAALTSNTVAS